MSVLAGQPQASIEPMMLYMGRLAREAARELALASTAQKNAALEAMAEAASRHARARSSKPTRTISTPRAARAATRPSSTGWR